MGRGFHLVPPAPPERAAQREDARVQKPILCAFSLGPCAHVSLEKQGATKLPRVHQGVYPWGEGQPPALLPPLGQYTLGEAPQAEESIGGCRWAAKGRERTVQGKAAAGGGRGTRVAGARPESLGSPLLHFWEVGGGSARPMRLLRPMSGGGA